VTRLRNNEAWEWPVDLDLLRDWLAFKGADVTSFKTERQALFVARELARQKFRMPPRNRSAFPELLKLQRMLCPKGAAPKRQQRRAQRPDPNAVTRDHRLGTFGAASPVRRIDPATYSGGAA
jgi:hypothetical protein